MLTSWPCFSFAGMTRRSGALTSRHVHIHGALPLRGNKNDLPFVKSEKSTLSRICEGTISFNTLLISPKYPSVNCTTCGGNVFPRDRPHIHPPARCYAVVWLYTMLAYFRDTPAESCCSEGSDKTRTTHSKPWAGPWRCLFYANERYRSRSCWIYRDNPATSRSAR